MAHPALFGRRYSRNGCFLALSLLYFIHAGNRVQVFREIVLCPLDFIRFTEHLPGGNSGNTQRVCRLADRVITAGNRAHFFPSLIKPEYESTWTSGTFTAW